MNTRIEEVSPTDIRDTCSGLRLNSPEAQTAMTRSLVMHGQISPLACRRDHQGIDLIDGFKRLRSCRSLQWPLVQIRVVNMTACCGKVEMIRLNQVSRSITRIEEALIVHALHQEDGWSLPEIARVVGRTLRWVTERFSPAKELHPQVLDHLFRGLISAGIAWELAHLPRGTQEECLHRMVKDRLPRSSVGTIIRQFPFLPWTSEDPPPAPSRQAWYRRLAGMNRRQQALLAGAVEDLFPDSEHDDRLLQEAMETMAQLRCFLDRQRHDQPVEIPF